MADISVLSLLAREAMVLLMAQLDIDTIRLVGIWRSEMMLLYLHTTENSLMEVLFAKMFKHGTYVLIPPAHAGN